MERETDTKTILIVEDNVGLNVLLTEKVNEQGYKTVSVHSGSEALNWLKTNTPYLMILDFSLPDMTGHELLANLKSTPQTVPPFIVSTGQGDESIAVEMMKLGAMDYLVKNMFFLNKLPEVLKRIGKEIENEDKRKWTEIELINSEQKYREMADSLPVGVFETDLLGNVTFVNQTIINWMGYTKKQLIDLNLINFIVDEDQGKASERLKMIISEKKSSSGEYTLKRISGDTFPVIVSSIPIIKNNIVHGLRGTIVDITERILAEIKLNVEQKRISTILATVGDPIFVKDNEHRFVLANRAFYDMLGLEEKDVIGRTLGESLPTDEMQHFLAVDRRVLDTGIPELCEEVLTAKNGIQLTIFTRKTRFLDNSGKAFLVGAIHDITERKKAEEETKLNAHRLKILVEILQYPTDSISGFLDHALHLAIELTNSKIGYMYHYSESKKEFILNSWSKNVMKECSIREKQTCYKLDKTGIWGEAVRQRKPIIINNFKAFHPLKKGLPEGHAHLDKFLTLPVFNNKQIVAVVAVANKETDYNDIDTQQLSLFMNVVWKVVERKKAEEELQNERLLLRTLIDNIPDGVYLKDLDACKTLSNLADIKNIGAQSEAEVLGKTDFELFPKELAEKYYTDDQLVIQSGNPIINREEFMFDEIGQIKWLLTTKLPLRNQLGQITGLVGIGRDITDRKQAEEELLELNLFNLQVINSAQQGIVVYDRNMKYLVWNPYMEHLSGIAASDVLGKHPLDFFPFLEEAGVIESIEKALKGETTHSRDFPYSIPSTGKTGWTTDSTAPFLNTKGEIIGAITVVQDITDRKLAEEKIREKDIQFRKISSNLPDLIFQFTRRPDGTYCVPIASEGIKNIFGCSPEDVIDNFAAIGRVIYPEDAARVISEIEYSAIHLTYFTCEFRVQLPGKAIQWIYSKSTPEKLADGSITWYGFNADITEKKLADLEILNTRNRLKKAQEIAHVGNWELDLETSKMWGSDEAFNIYGIENKDYILPLETVQHGPLPEYRPMLEKAMERLIIENQPYDLEFQILRKNDQEIRSIHSIAELETDEKGDLTKIIGVIQDISEQKKLENELRILSNAIEQNPASVVITDTKGDIEYVNPKFTQLTGYSINEVLGKNPRILKSGITTPEEYKVLWTTISSGNIWQGEFCNKKKDGTQYWESAIISPVFDTFGKNTHYVAIKEDITEKKETDRKLMNAVIEGEERERNRFSRELHDGLGPLLSSIKLYFQWISKIEDPEKKLFLTGKGNYNIDEAILTLREISNNLSPQSLNTFGLVLAIQNYIEGINQMKDIHIDLQSNIEKRFNKNVEIILYRVILELINNCLKHADAKEISLNLHHIEFAQIIRCTYKDNGKGLDLELNPEMNKGRGLLNIQYRITSINGKINMKSSPGNGLEVTIEVPVVFEK